MSEAALVENLPEGVWELIVNALLHQARGDPGDVFRLSLVCQRMYVLVVEEMSMTSCTYQSNLFADKPCVAESNQPTRSMAFLQRAARMVSGSIVQLNVCCTHR